MMGPTFNAVDVAARTANRHDRYERSWRQVEWAVAAVMRMGRGVERPNG